MSFDCRFTATGRKIPPQLTTSTGDWNLDCLTLAGLGLLAHYYYKKTGRSPPPEFPGSWHLSRPWLGLAWLGWADDEKRLDCRLTTTATEDRLLGVSGLSWTWVASLLLQGDRHACASQERFEMAWLGACCFDAT